MTERINSRLHESLSAQLPQKLGHFPTESRIIIGLGSHGAHTLVSPISITTGCMCADLFPGSFQPSSVWNVLHVSLYVGQTRARTRAHRGRRRSLMTRRRLLVSESSRRFTEQRPGPSRPPSSALQLLSPRLHSEEEPGAPGRSFPITLPQDGGLQMALLASTSHRNRPCVFNDAFAGTEVIFVPPFCRFFGGSTWEIPSSGLWQSWAPGKERRRRRRTLAT